MEYSELVREGYKRVLEHFYWLQRLPADDPKSRWTRFVRGKGYGTWSIAGVAPRIGVRETRRILGDYVLTEKDCLAGAICVQDETAPRGIDVKELQNKLTAQKVEIK